MSRNWEFKRTCRGQPLGYIGTYGFEIASAQKVMGMEFFDLFYFGTGATIHLLSTGIGKIARYRYCK